MYILFVEKFGWIFLFLLASLSLLVSNPLSSDQNNSFHALPRVPAVNTIDRRIIYQSTLVPTRVANQRVGIFFQT